MCVEKVVFALAAHHTKQFSFHSGQGDGCEDRWFVRGHDITRPTINQDKYPSFTAASADATEQGSQVFRCYPLAEYCTACALMLADHAGAVCLVQLHGLYVDSHASKGGTPTAKSPASVRHIMESFFGIFQQALTKKHTAVYKKVSHHLGISQRD